MKVFISHSSTDKWVARQLARQLGELGVETFLDEKDIQTGDSIDDKIQHHLADCDELLLLVTPASLSSAWVLIEVGGARALGKRLVPILFHVGANDLPRAIGPGLAREINDIERYYDELRTRLAAPKTPRKAAKVGPTRPARRAPASHGKAATGRKAAPSSSAGGSARPAFKTGDSVIITDRKPPSDNDDVQVLSWNSRMDQYLGRPATVVEILPSDPRRAVSAARLDIDDGQWAWGFSWLDPVTPRQRG